MSNNISDFERKKWIVSRIDTNLNAYYEERIRHQKTFLEESDKIINEHREAQKTILGLLGLAITIIIGIFYYFQNFPVMITLITIIITVLGSIVVGSLVYEIYLRGPINTVKRAYNFQIGDLAFVRGYFLKIVLDLEEYTIEQFETFAKFSKIAAAASELRILEPHEKLYNSIRLPVFFKSYVEMRIGTIENSLNSNSTQFEKLEKIFEDEEILKKVKSALLPIKGYEIQNTDFKKS